MDIATLGVVIDPSGAKSGASESVRAIDQVGDAGDRMQKRLNMSMGSLTAIFFSFNQAIDAVRKAIDFYNSTIGRVINTGVKFNATLETAQFAIAGTLQQFDSTGKINSFDAAMKQAASSITLLKSEALKSQATFESLLEAVSISAPTALAAGMSIENLIVTVRKLGSLYSSMGIMNVPSEIRQTITGRYTARDFGAMSLGANQEKLQQMVSMRQGNELAQYIQDLIAPRVQASEAAMEGFNGRLSNFIDLYQQVSAEISKDVFNELRESYAKLQNAISDDSLKKSLEEIAGGIARLVQWGTSLTVWALSHTAEIIRVAEAFGLLAVEIAAVMAVASAGAIGAGLLAAGPWIALAGGIALVAWNLDEIAPKAGLAIQALQAMFQQGNLGEFIAVTLELGFRRAVDALANHLYAVTMAELAAMSAIGTYLKNTFLELMKPGFWSDLGSTLISIATDFSSWLMKAGVQLYEYLKTAFEYVANIIKNAWSKITGGTQQALTAPVAQQLVAPQVQGSLQSFVEQQKRDGAAIATAFTEGYSNAYGKFDIFGEDSDRTKYLASRQDEIIAQTQSQIDAMNRVKQAAPGPKYDTTPTAPAGWRPSAAAEAYETDTKILTKYKQDMQILSEFREHNLMTETEYFARSKKLGEETYNSLADKANATAEILKAVDESLSLAKASDNLGKINAEIEKINGDPFANLSTKNKELNSLYTEQIAALQKLYELRKASLSNPDVANSPEATLKVQEEMRQFQTQIAQAQNNLATTTGSGQFFGDLQKWVNNFGSAAQQAAGVVTGTLDSAINSATSNLQKAMSATESWGEAFQQIGTDILTTLEQLIIKMLIVQGLQAAMGGIGGGAGGTILMSGMLAHTGGVMGRDSLPNASMSLPRYHGGGIVGDEVPAILKKGEGVFTEEQMKALGGSRETKVTILNTKEPHEIASYLAAHPDVVVNALGQRKSMVRRMIS